MAIFTTVFPKCISLQSLDLSSMKYFYLFPLLHLISLFTNIIKGNFFTGTDILSLLPNLPSSLIELIVDGMKLFFYYLYIYFVIGNLQEQEIFMHLPSTIQICRSYSKGRISAATQHQILQWLTFNTNLTWLDFPSHEPGTYYLLNCVKKKFTWFCII